MSPKREIDRFVVKAKNGNKFTIIQYQDYEIIHPLGSALPSEILGLMSYLTTGGLDVEYLDTKTFKIVQTDEIVWKV